jgi:hypothetical protein
MQDVSESLVVAEFSQMHEHIRKREEAMNQMLTITVTGATTLLTAVAAFVFQVGIANTSKFTIVFCYLLLAPIPFIFFTMATLSSHRDDIFKMGYFIKVFIEQPFGGAKWGTCLDVLRKQVRGESQDPATLALWALFASSAGLFGVSLSMLSRPALLHLLAVVPLLLLMLGLHMAFMRDRKSIEDAWIRVRDARAKVLAR